MRSARNSSAFTWLFAAWLMLLGHAIVPHTHRALHEPHIHTHTLGHTLADVFSTDLGEGHLANMAHEDATPELDAEILLPTSLPSFFSPQCVGRKPFFFAASAAIEPDYLRYSALRAPPTGWGNVING